ncbi:FAD-dependent oxidoreductase [Methanoculleus chikugoensis]|uniref:NAD(P)/FAD-dependent oxidoreductase n=1 Tax=Methanoculleus chikugoensis TaxID=118126 RepID=UPI0006D10D58|nr:NAD(P)/FAD-dependent oxidoreductase [Methanoculleus chikugoensis]
MQDRCDVIVVGAGPAGSTAARYAAKSGLDVLLIDKRRVIGVPVCCGGEFNASVAILASVLPNAPPGLDELFPPIDSRLIRREIREAVAVSPPGGREYEFELPPGYTVDRDVFDRHLADAAVREGAVLSPDTKFLGREGGRVTTSRGDIEARVVVAADGPLSRVCRSAGMERSAVLAPAITCRVDGGEFGDRLKFFFGNRIAPGGYAWVFPKPGCANVGLGVQKRGGTPGPGSPEIVPREQRFLRPRRPGRVRACLRAHKGDRPWKRPRRRRRRGPRRRVQRWRDRDRDDLRAACRACGGGPPAPRRAPSRPTSGSGVRR